MIATLEYRLFSYGQSTVVLFVHRIRSCTDKVKKCHHLVKLWQIDTMSFLNLPFRQASKSSYLNELFL